MDTMTFRATLKLRGSNDGGRKAAIVAYKKYAYRPHVIVRDGISICALATLDQAELLPGESAMVNIMVMQPERISSIERGDTFLLLESGYVVGEGLIVETGIDPSNFTQ